MNPFNVPPEVIQAWAQLGIGTLVLLVLLFAIFALILKTRYDQAFRIKDADNDRLRIERDSATAIVRAESENTSAQNQASLIEQNKSVHQLIERVLNLSSTQNSVATENARILTEVVALSKAQIATMETMSRNFSAAVLDFGVVNRSIMNDMLASLREDLQAHRAGTDAQLASIYAGMQYGNTTLDRIDADVVRRVAAHDQLLQQLESLPAQTHAELLADFERVVQAIVDLNVVIDRQHAERHAQVVDLLALVREISARRTDGPLLAESVPLNERAEEAI